MKKFYSFLFAAVALVGFAACNSDSTEEPAPAQENVGKMEFTANVGEDTKTSLDGMSVKWCAEDAIWVNFEKFQIKDKASYEAATSATFTGNTVVAPFVAVYPYNNDVAPNTKTTVFATLKANVGEGTFADGANIAVAYSEEGTNLSFKNVLSVLKFQVEADCETVTISSTSALVGKVVYKATDGTIDSFATTDADKTIELTIDGGFKAGKTYYTTVVPGTHALTIRTNGYLSTSKDSKTIVKNKIYNLGVLPAPEESGWELMGLNNWTNSAKMYKDFDWFVAYNITSSSNGFKFKKGGTWVGAKSEFSHKDVYAYPEGGSNILAEKSNTAYDFYYNPEGGLYMILPAGTDINQDIYVATDMFIRGNYTNYSGYGNWGKGRTPIVAQGKYFLFKEYTFSSNPEFKFSTSEEGWDWQYSTQNTLTENTWTTLNAGSNLDGNTKFSKPGTYDIYTTSDKNNRDKVLIITHGNAPAAMN